LRFLLAAEDMGDQIATASDAHLVEDRLQMVFDRVRRHAEFDTDLVGGGPTDHEQRDIAFAWGSQPPAVLGTRTVGVAPG
jgi:hypothetical protein